MCLLELYKPENAELNYCELIMLDENYSISVTEEQALLLNL